MVVGFDPDGCWEILKAYFNGRDESLPSVLGSPASTRAGDSQFTVRELQELAVMAAVTGILLVDFDNSLTDACEHFFGTRQNRTDCTVSVVGNNPQ